MADGTRPATSADHPGVVRVERRAGRLFLGTPMAVISQDEAVSSEEFAAFVDAGSAWVHEIGGAISAYLLVERLDDAAHVEQVSVDPSFARRGIGAELIGVAAGWARTRGLRRLTLTTFTEVPWNAPYYARIGFRVMPRERHGPELSARIRAEAGHGLDRWPRVAMERPALWAAESDRGRA